MTDLNKQLAESLGWKFGDVDLFQNKYGTIYYYDHPHQIGFNPLHDDAQCWQLAKKFKLEVYFDEKQAGYWKEKHLFFEQGETVNEAIVKAIIAISEGG